MRISHVKCLSVMLNVYQWCEQSNCSTKNCANQFDTAHDGSMHLVSVTTRETEKHNLHCSIKNTVTVLPLCGVY